MYQETVKQVKSGSRAIKSDKASVRTIVLIVCSLALVVAIYLWITARGEGPPAASGVITVAGSGVPIAPTAPDRAGSPAAAVPPVLLKNLQGDRIDPALDPIIGPSSPDLKMLHDQIASEDRDAIAAAAKEAKVSAAFASLPLLSRDAALRVVCASTMCEVVGRTTPGLAGTAGDAALGMLARDDVQNRLAHANMSMGPAELVGRSDAGSTFIAYVMVEGDAPQ